MANGDVVNGAINTVGGASTTTSGFATLGGAAKTALRAGGVGMMADGLHSVVNGKGWQGKGVGLAKMAIGGALTAARLNPVVGTALFLGTVGYENREAIGNMAGQAWNGIKSLF